MRCHQQGREWWTARRKGPGCRWVGLTILGCWASGCTPIPPASNPYVWPAPSAIGIWAIEPSTALVLGLDGNLLTIRWSDAVPPDTQPTVSLRLIPADPNIGTVDLADGLDALADGAADEWPFAGRDANGVLVPAGLYVVEYVIDDANDTDTATSEGTITVPLRFTSPADDMVIFESTLETDGLIIAWEAQDFGTIARLDIGLSRGPVDPNDSNDVLWVNADAIPLATGTNLLVFQGTVFDGTTLDATEPNSLPIDPDTYVVVGRITPTGTGKVGFFIQGPGRVTVLADPN